ncbi:MAG: thioredoxin fold domain-containing protein [Hydrogenophilales bacterium]|nr:thioredoxin fold domain-containing protein [Hydrogenophilales bacterium]
MHTSPLGLIGALLYTSLLLAANFTASASETRRGAYHGAMATEYPAWFKDSFLNLQDDIAEAKDANKRVMLLFTQDNCPYCNALIERNLAQKEIEELMRKRFDVVAVNMWGDREVIGLDGKKHNEKSFSASLRVQFTPTLLFLDETGQIILRLNGYLPPARFKTALEYVAQNKEKEIGYRDYLAARTPPSTGGELIKEDFFKPAPHDLTRKPRGKPRPLAVFFEQKDCPSCAELHEKVLLDKETRDVIRKFDVIQLDMWSSTPVITPQGKRLTAREWAKALDVKYAPTIVLFNEQDREIIRSEAFFKVFHTQGIFAYVAEGGYKTEPSFQRYLSARADKMREQGKDVDIWRMGDDAAGAKK